MNMIMKRELFEPQEIKEMYPVTEFGAECKRRNDEAVKAVLNDILVQILPLSFLVIFFTTGILSVSDLLVSYLPI